eukprot:5640458-Amphidinium_carterae.1
MSCLHVQCADRLLKQWCLMLEVQWLQGNSQGAIFPVVLRAACESGLWGNVLMQVDDMERELERQLVDERRQQVMA